MNNKKIMIAGGIGLFLLVVWIAWPKQKKGETMARTAEALGGKGAVQQLYQQAAEAHQSGDLLKAKESYEKIVAENPDFDQIASVQKELEQVNMDIIFSNQEIADRTVIHEIKAGDTLGKIAKQYNTAVELIKRSNNLKSDTIRLGQKLRIWTGVFNIFVDKSQNILFLKEGDEVVKVYNVSTGSQNSTPVGQFKIMSKLPDPVWFNRGVVVPPESPDNVLGSRWLGFDMPGYGIHGTIESETIGQQVTAGCVRMRNEDVEELYSILPVGTSVVIVN